MCIYVYMLCIYIYIYIYIYIWYIRMLVKLESFVAKFQQSKFQQSLYCNICRKVPPSDRGLFIQRRTKQNNANKKWSHANLLIPKQKKSRLTGRVGRSTNNRKIFSKVSISNRSKSQKDIENSLLKRCQWIMSRMIYTLLILKCLAKACLPWSIKN